MCLAFKSAAFGAGKKSYSGVLKTKPKKWGALRPTLLAGWAACEISFVLSVPVITSRGKAPQGKAGIAAGRTGGGCVCIWGVTQSTNKSSKWHKTSTCNPQPPRPADPNM